MGIGNFLKSLFESPETPDQQPTTHHIYVDQSQAKIHTAYAKNVTVGQIGGTINNSVKSQPEDESKTPKNSRAIGAANWEEYEP